MTRHRATFTPSHAGEWTEVQFPFDSDYLHVLKRAVPANRRSWNPDRRVWLVDALYADRVSDGFDQVEVDRVNDQHAHQWWQHQQQQNQRQPTPPAPFPARTPGPDLETILVDLFTVLPSYLRAPCHRALLRAVHPDAGGDTETTISLNRAWTKAVAA